MIVMSFAQTALRQRKSQPQGHLLGAWAMDLPVIVPIVVGLACGSGGRPGEWPADRLHQDSAFHRHARHDGLGARCCPLVVERQSDLVSHRGLCATGEWRPDRQAHLGLLHWPGQNPAMVFILLAILFHLIMRYTLYGKRCYAIGSNEDAARMSGINVARHKVLVYSIAGMLAAIAAIMLTSKNLTAQAGMGVMYELDAIAMAVIGGISLSGGRGSIIGTVLGALIFSVIISGFTSIRLDAYYQDMVKGAIIVGAVVLDQRLAAASRARCGPGGAEKMTDIVLKTEGLTKYYGGVHALEERRLRDPQRRARRHHGRQRRRQVHLRAPDHRRRAADPRADLCSTARRSSSRGPTDARESGIEAVFQNLALADDLDVPSNLFLGREKIRFNLGPFSILDRRFMREATRKALERTGGQDSEPLEHHPAHVGRPAAVRGDRPHGDASPPS